MHDTPVTRICRFVRQYRSDRGRTPRLLYDDTGYATSYASITQEQIEAIVAQDSALIAEWISFTDDKRWTPAWGLAKREDKWVVFHIAAGGTYTCEISFDSSIRACALMIRMEMEAFRLKDG